MVLNRKSELSGVIARGGRTGRKVKTKSLAELRGRICARKRLVWYRNSEKVGQGSPPISRSPFQESIRGNGLADRSVVSLVRVDHRLLVVETIAESVAEELEERGPPLALQPHGLEYRPRGTLVPLFRRPHGQDDERVRKGGSQLGPEAGSRPIHLSYEAVHELGPIDTLPRNGRRPQWNLAVGVLPDFPHVMTAAIEEPLQRQLERVGPGSADAGTDDFQRHTGSVADG